MAPRASIVLYYDIVSPYSYFGFNLLKRYRQQWKDVDVVLQPAFLAGLMSTAKNQPPATVAAKGAYMFADLNNVSAASGIPFKFPSEFPVLTIQTMRLLIVLQRHEADKYEQCIEKLYEEYWCNDKNVSQKDILISALTPIIGSEAKVEEYYEMTGQKEIKQALIDNTQTAFEAGAFGMPTFIVKKAGSDEEHMFFGSDRFELMASVLELPYYGLAPNPAAKL